jgi:hypothetical protein
VRDPADEAAPDGVPLPRLHEGVPQATLLGAVARQLGGRGEGGGVELGGTIAIEGRSREATARRNVGGAIDRSWHRVRCGGSAHPTLLSAGSSGAGRGTGSCVGLSAQTRPRPASLAT